MATESDAAFARILADAVQPLRAASDDLDRLVDLVGDARCVLLGEATHGTHEFYRLRADITRRLVLEKGFTAVAAEADWPDAHRVDRFVRGDDRGRARAIDALADFRRFPAWMWRNADVVELVSWLHAHNQALPAARRVGFYGLDLYSLHASMAAVLDYLDRADPEAASRARQRYACFDHHGEDPQLYGRAASLGLTEDCQRAVIAQLRDMQAHRGELLARDGLDAEDAQFAAEQNAKVVRDAEEYYRSMFLGRVSTWNLRDTHMADTLDALLGHLGRRFDQPKVVVWAHNSHVGDARWTEVGAEGELNLGQLTRQRHPGRTRLVGFSTYDGTVTAADDWGEPAQRMTVRPALPGSYEALFHAVGIPRFLLVPEDLGDAGKALDQSRLQRAIGVVYRPRTERRSHYYHVRLPRQLDALIHIDRTRAVVPLERSAGWERGEAPETWPTGL
jgi:erythromycin esterase-like protein